jgi:chlorite dismutase
MRFDEASAWYAEFGPFYVGLQFSPSELPRYLEGEVPELATAEQAASGSEPKRLGGGRA